MSQDNKGSRFGKVGELFTEVKTHWKTPAEGKYVPYRDYRDIFIAVGSNYVGAKTLESIGFFATCLLMMYHYKLPYLTFSIINIINMPLGYIWTLIWWFVCDNLGFLPKKTEKKLYAIRYKEDFTEFETNGCYNENYYYNNKHNISLYNFNHKKFLFFNFYSFDYKEGNVCKTEYQLEESYIKNFIEKQLILENLFLIVLFIVFLGIYLACRHSVTAHLYNILLRHLHTYDSLSLIYAIIYPIL